MARSELPRVRAVCAVVAATVMCLVHSTPLEGHAGRDLVATLDLRALADGTQWVKVTQQPYAIPSWLDGLCRIPTQDDYDSVRKRDPHAAAYVNVYVNTTGAPAITSLGTEAFPRGSVLVKEKFYQEQGWVGDAVAPSLYTVMVKREAGYNPEVGDWEFAVISGAGDQIQGRGKIETCMSCHKGRQATDYVFGSYLRGEAR